MARLKNKIAKQALPGKIDFFFFIKKEESIIVGKETASATTISMTEDGDVILQADGLHWVHTVT